MFCQNLSKIDSGLWPNRVENKAINCTTDDKHHMLVRGTGLVSFPVVWLYFHVMRL